MEYVHVCTLGSAHSGSRLGLTPCHNTGFAVLTFGIIFFVPSCIICSQITPVWKGNDLPVFQDTRHPGTAPAQRKPRASTHWCAAALFWSLLIALGNRYKTAGINLERLQSTEQGSCGKKEYNGMVSKRKHWPRWAFGQLSPLLGHSCP